MTLLPRAHQDVRSLGVCVEARGVGAQRVSLAYDHPHAVGEQVLGVQGALRLPRHPDVQVHDTLL